jgi:putative oxygen-independent coproporphyrinogen III oxidase
MTGSPLALYIHWPFCASKCPYCDFNSHVRDQIDIAAWAHSYHAELQYWAALTTERPIHSIFFGGGTPSLMPASLVERILTTIHDGWSVDPGCEITLEANPGSVEQAKFMDFRNSGVNRVSIGVQSLDDAVLKFLGRRHTAAEARQAVGVAAQVFERFSFDLIYARPDQTLDQWQAELGEALTFAPKHLSLYQLTIEENTGFYTAYQRGDFVMPDDELAGAFYELTQDLTAARGLPAYEISNHAAPGHESRHNLTYWRYDDYLGIGPGAHGRVTLGPQRYATRTVRTPEAWLKAVAAQGHGLSEQTALVPEEMAQEYLLMGLRILSGIAAEDFLKKTGRALMDVCSPTACATLEDAGFITWDGHTLRATAAGRQRLSSVLQHLVARS